LLQLRLASLENRFNVQQELMEKINKDMQELKLENTILQQKLDQA